MKDSAQLVKTADLINFTLLELRILCTNNLDHPVSCFDMVAVCNLSAESYPLHL